MGNSPQYGAWIGRNSSGDIICVCTSLKGAMMRMQDYAASIDPSATIFGFVWRNDAWYWRDLRIEEWVLNGERNVTNHPAEGRHGTGMGT